MLRAWWWDLSELMCAQYVGYLTCLERLGHQPGILCRRGMQQKLTRIRLLSTATMAVSNESLCKCSTESPHLEMHSLD
jgi:hypothetical protein